MFFLFVIYEIFFPSDDGTYLPEEKMRQEYVLSAVGTVRHFRKMFVNIFIICHAFCNCRNLHFITKEVRSVLVEI